MRTMSLPRWQTRDFRLFWAGETVSELGSQVTLLALPMTAILTLNATPTWVGFVIAATWLPVIVVSPLAGLWLDRHRSRPLILVTHAARAVVLAAVPLLAWAGMLTLPALAAVALLVGGFTAASELAYLSYLPTLVDRDNLAAANGAMEASSSAAQLAGPGLAGLLIQVATAPVAIIVDAVSYVFAGWTLFAVRSREQARDAPRTTARGAAREIADGVRHAVQDPVLRGLMAVSASFNFFEQAVLTLFLLYTTRVLHLHPGTVGLVLTAAGVGSIVGAASSSRVGQRLALGGGVAVASVSLALVPAVSGTGPWTPIAIAAMFALYGFGVTVFNVHAITLRQLRVEPTMLGRVNASYRTIVLGAAAFGALAGGAVGGLLGLRPALALAGAGLVVGAVAFMRSAAVQLRGSERRPELA